MQEVRHLVLDVSPEACITPTFLGKSCYTFLNGIAIVEGILLHLFHHQLLQGSVLGLVKVVPHAVQELVKPVLAKQLPHSLVSYHLVPDGLLGSIAVVDVGHIEMHLAGLLVIPASDFLAFLDCFLRLRIGHFLGRLHHIHLAAHLLGYAGDMITNDVLSIAALYAVFCTEVRTVLRCFSLFPYLYAKIGKPGKHRAKLVLVKDGEHGVSSRLEVMASYHIEQFFVKEELATLCFALWHTQLIVKIAIVKRRRNFYIAVR